MAKRPGDQRMYDQLQTFLDVGRERGFFHGAPDRVTLAAEIDAWLPRFKAAMDPAALSDAHKKAIQPHVEVFDATHRRLLALKQLLEGWAIASDKETDLAARIPQLAVGDEPEDELAKLKAWPGVFAELFDRAALPPLLAPAELKRQVAAHERAAAELPATSAGQIYNGGRKALVALRGEGIDLQERMHSSLDGAFGRTGEQAYLAKKPFGYDRRLRGGGRNRGRRSDDAPAAPGASAAKEAGGG